MKPLEGRKRRFGDRRDGFLVRNLDPMGKLIPFIMRSKADSWVLFENKIDITHTQDFLHQMRKSQIPKLTLYHIIFAAIVRSYSQVPELNRFIAGNNIYARNEMKGSMVVMKGMQRDSERTMIMPRFEMDATLPEVVEEIERLANPIDKTVKVKEDSNANEFDKLELALDLLPNFLIRFFFILLKWLDKHGWIPRFLTALSPFHASFFITNMGSIGMEPVYHHIYEFGTISIFGAIGSKNIVYELDRNGQSHRKVYLNMKFVVDERICDGFVYAMGFKHIKGCISHPEQLLKPPKQVIHDTLDRKH
ncbi:MAG: 2-oxo acid dehydrogenase subunit E2 [Lachnospiraceae bacterium]|jgi:hypothetical protein|nr:2-oxo acid dehydrogenase subunit E2 [Lachnospiraceae bacterium]